MRIYGHIIFEQDRKLSDGSDARRDTWAHWVCVCVCGLVSVSVFVGVGVCGFVSV